MVCISWFLALTYSLPFQVGDGVEGTLAEYARVLQEFRQEGRKRERSPSVKALSGLPPGVSKLAAKARRGIPW